MLFMGIFTVYPVNHTNPVNTLCVRSAELLTAKTDGAHNHDMVLNG
jgi:hypothetical protein